MPVLAIIVIAVIVIGAATAVTVPAIVSDPVPPAPRPEVPAAVAPLDPGPKVDESEQPVESELSGLPGWNDGPLETYDEPIDARAPAADPDWEPEFEEPADSVRTGGMSGALNGF